MSALWWLQPGWKDALCARCGRNIWDSGGDPDTGVCFDCFFESRQQEGPGPDGPLCDICGNHPAVSGYRGVGVCSQECEHDARERDGVAAKEAGK